jgi:hypothetical protein
MRVERITEDVFLVLTGFGTVRVSDASLYRSYFLDKPVPDALALALACIGVNVADAIKDGGHTEVEFDIGLALNDTKIAIHCRKGGRGRLEKAIDDILCLTEENWRKP